MAHRKHHLVQSKGAHGEQNKRWVREQNCKITVGLPGVGRVAKESQTGAFPSLERGWGGEEGQSQDCYSKTVIYAGWYRAPNWTSNVLKSALNFQVLCGLVLWFNGVSSMGPQPTLPRHSSYVASSGIRASYLVDRNLWRPRKTVQMETT